VRGYCARQVADYITASVQTRANREIARFIFTITTEAFIALRNAMYCRRGICRAERSVTCPRSSQSTLQWFWCRRGPVRPSRFTRRRLRRVPDGPVTYKLISEVTKCRVNGCADVRWRLRGRARLPHTLLIDRHFVARPPVAVPRPMGRGIDWHSGGPPASIHAGTPWTMTWSATRTGRFGQLLPTGGHLFRVGFSPYRFLRPASLPAQYPINAERQ